MSDTIIPMKYPAQSQSARNMNIKIAALRFLQSHLDGQTSMTPADVAIIATDDGTNGDPPIGDDVDLVLSQDFAENGNYHEPQSPQGLMIAALRYYQVYLDNRADSAQVILAAALMQFGWSRKSPTADDIDEVLSSHFNI